MREKRPGVAVSATSRSELNKRLISALEDSDWESMKTIYIELAEQLRKSGASSFEVIRLARRCELKALQPPGVTHVRVAVNGSDCCVTCQGLDGRVFPVSKALLLNPLPSNDCRFNLKEGAAAPGWCRCTYFEA